MGRTTTEITLADVPVEGVAVPGGQQHAAPAVVELRPAIRRARKGRRIPGTKVPRAEQVERGLATKKGMGTKLQTQVPREWREKILAMAEKSGVRESDVIRDLIRKGLGISRNDARNVGIEA